MGIGIRLKTILRERKMTIKQLSEISGISLNTLYSITKRDSERIDSVHLQSIADALGISPADLLEFGTLPEKEIELGGRHFTLSEDDIECFAFNDFLGELGYKTQIDTVRLNNGNKDVWIVTDIRKNKQYRAETKDLNKLMDIILSYSKFQIAEMLKNLEEIDLQK